MNLTISGQFERTMVQVIGEQQYTNKLRIRDISLYKCLDVRLSFLYFDPRIFVLSRRSTPSQTESSGLSIITRIILEIKLLTVLNSFLSAVKTYKPTLFYSNEGHWNQESISYCIGTRNLLATALEPGIY